MSLAQKKSRDLASLKRLVLKVGSALLIDGARQEIRRPWLESLVQDVVACRARGQEVVIVSSGSVALGRRVMKLPVGTLRLEEKQAAAACGQIRLAQTYQEALGEKGFVVAQVLLTPADTEERQAYLNVRATLRNLLDLGVIPVINENDTVATPSHRFGDNDRLAARVATMIEADGLVLLSDIDGLYTADPTRDALASFIPDVQAMTPDIFEMAGEAQSGYGSGGMRTKLEAARIAMGGGCAMLIARGNVTSPLRAVEEGGRCTWFWPSCSPAAARKMWIAGSLNPRGKLTIDDGAAKALRKGKSLLSVGVHGAAGGFQRGDAVSIVTSDGKEIARGLSAYDKSEAQKIMGRHSDEIEALLGYNGREEIVHRDDLALL